MKTVGIIPSRLAATRLPNKPLLDIGGKTLLHRVWERARQAEFLDAVYVATPDEAIRQAVEKFGGRVLMTADSHRSGTDRLAEAAHGLEADIIVNIQGDEPMLDPATIEQVCTPLWNDSALLMSSAMCPCPPEGLDDPACVKVVCDMRGNALYFSRSRIPFPRDQSGEIRVRQHIGLYAYRREFLLRFAALPPTPLERAESLEQLRALEHGFSIRMVEVAESPLSVDTPEDLAALRERLQTGSHSL